MRPVLPGDITAAARILLPVPPGSRARMARRLIDEACAADAHCQAQGKAHRRWGNGTLLAAAHAHPMGREMTFDDVDYLSCQLCVIEALLSHFRAGGLATKTMSIEGIGRVPAH
jgi:hypothetical protein